MLETNTLKEKLRQNNTCICVMTPFPSTGLTELIGRSNVDAICFDSEHGSLEISQIEDLARTCELINVTPLCRIPFNRPEIVLRVMDAGVMGIVCPHIKTKEQVEELISYIKYPPVGNRGMAMTARAPGYIGYTVEEYTSKSNEETMVIIQIEDYEGVENFESIIEASGIDAVFIGRNDLALSMGYLGNVKAPEVQKAINHVTELTLKAGLNLMIASDEIEGQTWVSAGANIISINIVPAVRKKLTEAVKILQSVNKTV